MGDEHFDDFDDEADGVLCPRCDGLQTVSCHCGGDLCFCENNGEKDCPFCGGEFGGRGYVSEERADAYLKREREMMQAFSPKTPSPVRDED
jgi:hypothetical protein